jgi:AraC family transcriptional regulator of adaptative response / DNA-3-methyladenine glycosylase II
MTPDGKPSTCPKTASPARVPTYHRCMALDPDISYLAVRSRDARFDGRLFVGVTSTGIYCRPICRVRTPKRENCRFFETPAQAEAADFRPCLKCRPETAPGPGHAWSVMDASSTLARQAAEAFDALAFTRSDEAPDIAALASRLGVSDRHLRRIFVAEHGVTPVQYLQTRRLLLAKQLLTDSRIPVTQVALASGFRSVRRFNAAFAERYRLSPSRLRDAGSAHAPIDAQAGTVELTLGYRPPLDAQALLRFFERRAVPAVEIVDIAAASVRRTLRAGVLAPQASWIEARFVAERAQVRLRLAPALAHCSAQAARAARRWLDLDAAPEVIDSALNGLAVHGDEPSGTRLPDESIGTRLPGALDGFELAVRAVLGQRVTVAAARTLARRLVDRFGARTTTPWPELDRAFPAPKVIAKADAERIGELGILRAQVGAMQQLAASWPTLEAIAGAPSPLDERARALVARLVELPGLGPWTAHYIAMRWLGWPDAFPPGDIAVLKAMGLAALGKGARAEREAEQRSQAWRPWRAYAVLRLWNG